MEQKEQKDNEEPPAVSVFVRPLEVTVPAESPPPPPSEPPPKTVWSTMTTRLETETSIKRWSTPQVKTEEGLPPGPEDRPETKEGKARDGAVKTITPSYKLGEEKPSHELKLGTSGHLPSGQGDYKVSMRHEDYKLTVIDPKVRSNANMPVHSATLPDERRKVAGDFPSQHSKRSLIKLEPLEQRRFKSVESRPVTTSNYLTESVERHREMEASRLREYLKAKEGDANKPWNKPGWPGPKKNDDESLRELEHIKKSIETLQKKVRASSMQNLHIPSPSEFEKQNPTPQRSPVDPGWLVKLRTNRYLEHTKGAGLTKHRSEDLLREVGLPSPYSAANRPADADPLHWQLRKEFHLTKYSERRASWSQEIRSDSIGRPRQEPPPPPPPPQVPEPQRQPQAHADHYPEEPPSNLSKQKSRSQLLYPPGSTEDIASESRPARRPLEKIVYENKPLAPSVVAVKVGTDHDGSTPRQGRTQAPARDPEEDYPERLMSPPPGHQPRSILKSDRYAHQQQYASQQYQYSSQQQRQYQEEYYEDRRHIEAPPHSHGQQQAPPHSHGQQQAPPHSHGQQQAPPPHSHGQAPPPAPPIQAPPPQPKRPHSTSFQDLSEEERYRIMQENLQKHRQAPSYSSSHKQPVTSFNGPFFKIEEVDPRQANGGPPRQPDSHYEYEAESSYSLQQMKQMSASEVELEKHYPKNQEDSNVVVWPPPSEKKRPRSQSAMAKNIADPERIDELRRQQALEREAMQRHEEEKMRSMEKQIRAMQIQQQRLYEQQHGVTSPVPMMDTIEQQPSSQQYPSYQNAQQPQYSQPPPEHIQSQPQQFEDPGHAPQNVRVFETRPISSMSEMTSPTWKRTYVVDKPKDVEKNEILTSEELLEKEQYEVDLLKRREAFVEKPERAPEIHRIGRRWQPPPEKPYVWPTLRRAISVEPGMEPVDFGPGVPRSLDDVEYKWAPTVHDPGYRRERKNFTPTNSPPNSPRRGGGTGPLDEPAKRQTKYVIQPSSDGSHRPKPAFRKERHAPSGGFFPHAPNAIKVVKRRAASVAGMLSPSDQQDQQDVEIIRQRNYHRIDTNGYHAENRSASAVDHRLRREGSHASEHELAHMNDWEKIYELPPHSSTISGKDVPRHVDVRRRLNKFEGSIQNLAGRQSVARAASVESSNSIPYPPPDYDVTVPVHRKQRSDQNQSRQKTSRRNSTSSLRMETPQHATRQESRASRSSRPQSRAPSSIMLSPAPRGDTPNALRVRSQIARSTAPSPTPISYERARAYQPPALPPGYRLGDAQPDPRATSPSPGHTKRMIGRKAATQPAKNEDLDRLKGKTDEMLERSKQRSAYKLIDSEIVKQGPEPVPQAFKDQVRDLLESRNSTETTTTKDHDRSGYVTDVSNATWQFSTQSFSPRSVVSVNGARDDILKDDKPRSIMKRRELESREQMMYPSNQQLVEHKQYQRSQSNVSKPSVTETVQRFEETRRTEEVERRVQRKERRERRSRHHSSSRHQSGREAWDSGYHSGVRSSSLSRGHNGYLPSSQESYYRQSTTRRDRDHSQGRWEDEQFGRGLAHARYGSLSDSLRKGELKYIPNGEVRESHMGGGRNMHKSYSTRDVFGGGDSYDRRSQMSQRRASQQVSPFVEFPPTLPRRSGDRDGYRPLSKSRSYADWDDQNRAGFGREVRRYDDDMGRLEAEFRDSLLMPMPRGGHMNERDHRTEKIPGGYETYHRENKGDSGRRLGRDGQPVDFQEATQEYNYKREQEYDPRRR